MATSLGAGGWSSGSTLRPIISSSSSWLKYMKPFLSYALPTALILSEYVICTPRFVEEVHWELYAGPRIPGSRRTVAFKTLVSIQGRERFA
jgi:hypothetical protein